MRKCSKRQGSAPDVGTAWRLRVAEGYISPTAQQTEQTASLRLLNRFRLDQALTPLYKHGAYRNYFFHIFIYIYNLNIYYVYAILYLFLV